MSLRRRFADQLLRAMRAAARPLTEAELDAPTLVVAPHPDDETLAAGGLVAIKRARGVRVHIAFLTSGEAGGGRLAPEALAIERRREGIAAAEVLGVPAEAVSFFNLPDGRVHEHGPEAARRLAELIAKERPAMIVAPARPDGHADHEAAALAAARARAMASTGGQVRLFAAPVWLWRHFPWVGRHARKRGSAFRRVRAGGLRLLAFNRVLPLEPATRARKREALLRHASQVGPDGREGIGAIAGGEWLAHLMADAEFLREV